MYFNSFIIAFLLTTKLRYFAAFGKIGLFSEKHYFLLLQILMNANARAKSFINTRKINLSLQM